MLYLKKPIELGDFRGARVFNATMNYHYSESERGSNLTPGPSSPRKYAI